MYEEKSTLKNIGAYDDYEPLKAVKEEGEGLLSPFTFLCFALVLALFGVVTLLSASYDTALRENSAFYSIFMKQVGSAFLGLIIGTAVCFVPQKILRKFHFGFSAVYVVLFVLTLTSRNYTPSFMYTSVMGLTGGVSLMFLLSDLVPRIISHEKRGLCLIFLVTACLFILISEALACGSGWYVVSFIVIISSLLSLKVKRSFILYFTIAAVITLVLLTLSSQSMLSQFTSSVFPLSDTSYYSSSLYLSENAISEGGFIGVGIGNGLYKLGLISDIEGEFIFASLGEETGAVGTFIILFCLLMIMIIGFRSSSRAFRKGEYFISSATLCSSSLLAFTMLMNMFYVSGLLPFDGVPLLLFSYNPIVEILTMILLCLLYKFIFRMGREKSE